MKQEEKRLNRISNKYLAKKSFDKYLVNFSAAKIIERAKGPDVLELGSAEGLMTDILSKNFKNIDVVEAANRYINLIKNKKLKNVRVHNYLIENFVSDKKFDDIIMARLLEHVASPTLVLKKTMQWLKPGGRIHIVVPNANSLNRRIGQVMGIINKRTELDKHDQLVGHRRVYTNLSLKKNIIDAGLEVSYEDGIFLKPLSNKQMLGWSKKIIDALFIVGNEYPDLCSEIYIIATLKK